MGKLISVLSLPVLSLVVAALAVVFGPFVSLRIARRQVMSSLRIADRQVTSSLEVANKQIIGPMRQAWINSLRDLLAEIACTAHHYFEGRLAYLPGDHEERLPVSTEDLTDEERQRLSCLEHKIQLMLNPKEDDHRKLEQLIRTMIVALDKREEVSLDEDEEDTKFERDFVNAHSMVMKLSRELLKREWDRV